MHGKLFGFNLFPSLLLSKDKRANQTGRGFIGSYSYLFHFRLICWCCRQKITTIWFGSLVKSPDSHYVYLMMTRLFYHCVPSLQIMWDFSIYLKHLHVFLEKHQHNYINIYGFFKCQFNIMDISITSSLWLNMLTCLFQTKRRKLMHVHLIVDHGFDFLSLEWYANHNFHNLFLVFSGHLDLYVHTISVYIKTIKSSQ